MSSTRKLIIQTLDKGKFEIEIAKETTLIEILRKFEILSKQKGGNPYKEGNYRFLYEQKMVGVSIPLADIIASDKKEITFWTTLNLGPGPYYYNFFDKNDFSECKKSDDMPALLYDDNEPDAAPAPSQGCRI